MVKAIKHLSRPTAQYIFGSLGGFIAFAVISRLLYGANESSGDMVSAIMLMFCSILCMSVVISYHITFCAMALSMGATRKGFFGAIQVHKAIIALGFFLVIQIMNFILPYIYPVERAFDLNSSLSTAALCIFLATFGESLGILCSRFGKIGLYIYMGIFGIIGGIMGFSAVSFNRSSFDINSILSSLPSAIILAAVLIIALIMCFVNWAIFKKINVTGV